MRIWDIPPQRLCRKHLLGEHRELHAVWSVITGGKKGYSTHPEVLRWKGRLKALYLRHEQLLCEMWIRGYSHSSPLDYHCVSGPGFQDRLVDTVVRQEQILRSKRCGCKV